MLCHLRVLQWDGSMPPGFGHSNSATASHVPTVSHPAPRPWGAGCRDGEVAKGHLCLMTPSGQGGWWDLESSTSPTDTEQAVRRDPAHVHVGHSSLGGTHHPAAAWCPLAQALTQ